MSSHMIRNEWHVHGHVLLLTLLAVRCRVECNAFSSKIFPRFSLFSLKIVSFFDLKWDTLFLLALIWE
jgi:hypothetical protein